MGSIFATSSPENMGNLLFFTFDKVYLKTKIQRFELLLQNIKRLKFFEYLIKTNKKFGKIMGKKIILSENQLRNLLILHDEKIFLNEEFKISDFIKKAKKNASKLKNPANFSLIVKKVWQNADPKIKPFLGQMMLEFEDNLNLQDFLQVLKRVGPILTKAQQRIEEEKPDEQKKDTGDKEQEKNIKIPSI